MHRPPSPLPLASAASGPSMPECYMCQHACEFRPNAEKDTVRTLSSMMRAIGGTPSAAASAQLLGGLKWKDTAWFESSLCFAGKVVKVNARGRKQTRVLVVTREVVASCYPSDGKATRAFPAGAVEEMWVEEDGDEAVVVFKVPSQYDLMVRCGIEAAQQLIGAMRVATAKDAGCVGEECVSVRNVLRPARIGDGKLAVEARHPEGWTKNSHLTFLRRAADAAEAAPLPDLGASHYSTPPSLYESFATAASAERELFLPDVWTCPSGLSTDE